jgi:methionyl aminopeptidase
MIAIKNKVSIVKMETAGALLAEIFDCLGKLIVPGISTLEIDAWIADQLHTNGLVSKSRGYRGYAHVSCISVNDEVIHGVPRATNILRAKDIVKVDVCASWKGYCADMARCFFVGEVDQNIQKLVSVAQAALDKGIQQVQVGNRVSDISAAIQQEIERSGFGIIRDFAGHGIGKNMHEAPEILNYGEPGKGPFLRAGMAFAIEPMITMGNHEVYVTNDGWTVKTSDKSLSAHVEDTVIVTENGPKILTRLTSGREL